MTEEMLRRRLGCQCSPSHSFANKQSIITNLLTYTALFSQKSITSHRGKRITYRRTATVCPSHGHIPLLSVLHLLLQPLQTLNQRSV